MRALIFAAIFSAAACSPSAPPPQQQQQQQQAGAAIQQASSSKPAAEVAITTTPALDSAFLIGRWGDNGDCSKDVTLNADGSFTSYTGGEGQWSLSGSTMRMAGKQSTQEVEVQRIDQNTIRITNPDGSVGTSQRCV